MGAENDNRSLSLGSRGVVHHHVAEMVTKRSSVDLKTARIAVRKEKPDGVALGQIAQTHRAIKRGTYFAYTYGLTGFE